MAEATTTIDRNAIRADVDAVCTAYLALLDSLSAEDWKRKSANPAWTVGTLMWHLGRGMEFFSEAVGFCRKGKAPNPPQFLVNPVNSLLNRFGSRGATPESARAKYTAAHDALASLLDTIQDDEWSKAAKVYGTPYTVESAFQGPRSHFEEHKVDVLKGLGRS